ncbi:MAG TPA: hypothetical protein VFM46_08940 [Pseudomonadales bacterium]|nr:hypothetical protein [Pseudomonadales bacterium]
MDRASDLVQDVLLFSELKVASQRQTTQFDAERLSAAIDHAARRALFVSDAESQLALARLFEDDQRQALRYAEKAESIAYELGQLEYAPRAHALSPFDNQALAQAWLNGWTRAAQDNPYGGNDLAKQIWDFGIDVENQGTQYQLAAVRLYEIAAQLSDTKLTERALELAEEFSQYSAQNLPPVKRQQEIDRFMASQAKHLAAALDF